VSAPGVEALLGSWRLDPGVMGSLVVAGAAYAWGVRTLGARGGRWPLRRMLAFAAGLAVTALALESGLEGYGDRLLSVHMVSHLLLMLVAAPLLCAGSPIGLALRSRQGARRQALARALKRPLWRALSHPATGLCALTLTMLVTHLTPLYDLALREPALHGAEHALYLAGALCFWSVVFAPGPRPGRLAGMGRVVYLLASMPAMSAVAAVLEIDSSPRYPTYVLRSRALGVDALSDQRVAAGLMWVAGSLLVAVVALGVAWQSMAEEERRARRREALSDRGRPALGAGSR